ncbi:MAG: nucleotidyltransferase [Planctomycetota bacterium]|nr:nucleotidyltransferase [Planctomycetota bacterium]
MLNSDYKDMLQVLLDNGVKFLLVGAYAMGAHGYPRATGDIDIWVEPSAENSARVYRSMAAFGAPLHEIDETTFTTLGIVFQIGVAPRRIDIITTISGVGFDGADQQRQIVEIDGLSIPILSLDDLIRNKRATSRDKDRLDADRLEKERP